MALILGLFVIWFLVSWVAWNCPGGLLSGYWPAQARPLVCQAKPQRLITSNLEVARRMVREQGPVAVLERCQGLRCRELPVKWQTVADFGEGE